MSVILKVKVTTKAAKNRIGDMFGDYLKVYVTAAPQKGRANCAVVTLIAEKLGIPGYDIEITSGNTSKLKELSIENITEEDLNKLRGE